MLKQLQDASPEDGALDEACRKMQALISAVGPPEPTLTEAGQYAFKPRLCDTVLSDIPPQAKVMVMVCWVMMTMITKDMHLCVNTKYYAA